jgi:hypothetical protein
VRKVEQRINQAKRENQVSGRQELDKKGRREKIEDKGAEVERWYLWSLSKAAKLASERFPLSGELSSETQIIKEYTRKDDYCCIYCLMNHLCQDISTFPIILQSKLLYNTSFNMPLA